MLSCHETKSFAKKIQAHSQICATGVAKLSWRNHLAQNLKVYFILYVITIKLRMCLQEKIELSSLSQRA